MTENNFSSSRHFMTGFVSKIESFSAVDGGGLRAVVFMRGCPLKCVYCHNPEIAFGGGADEYTADELFKKVMRFKPYFGKSGGVTASGGEPLVQAAFLAEFFKKLKENGVKTAVETAGFALTQDVKKLLSLTDLLLIDLKFYSGEGYQNYTSGNLDTVLGFLDYVNTLIVGDDALGVPHLRTVIIPDINDAEKDIKNYAALAKAHLTKFKYELLPFHTMGFSKYEKFGFNNPLKDTPSLAPEKLAELSNLLSKLLVNN